MSTFKPHLRLALIIIASITLGACGGGSSSGGGSATSNKAPSFASSSASISVSEDSTGVIYTASATDADGDAITYSVSGGADHSQFKIDASSGQLRFKSSPNYDDPQDSNKNNVYEVEISAKDSSVSSSMNLTVTVTAISNTDTSAPTEPQLISLASADATSMDVDWIGSSDDYTGSEFIEYQIHAATTSGFTPANSTLQSSVSNTISATITGLEASTEYFVVVLALDQAGNQSTSGQKSVTTSASAATASDEAVTIEAGAITTVSDDSLTLEKTSATEALQVDDILVSDQDDGLLLKIESITDNGSELEVTTAQATLVDAFEQVQFNLLTTLEDIDTDSEAQGLFPTGQSARGLSSPTLRSNQSSQELHWPSGLRLQHENSSAHSSALSFQPALAVSSVQAIDESGAGTLASAYEVYATSSDAVISFDVVLEIESGYSFGDIEVEISHNTLPAPDYEVIEKSSTSSRKEYRIQWDNSGATSSAPFEVDISAIEQDCWVLCTLNVRTEAYVLDADKDSLFDNKYTFEASNSSGSAQVTASTGIGFSPDFDIFVQIDGFAVEHALTQITGELKLENTLQFLASASSEVDHRKTLFSKKFVKIIMAGTVPIVLSGKLQLDGQLSASISGEVSLDALAESSLIVSAGVEYKNGEFTYIDNAETTYKFEVIGDAGATIAGELRLIPELDISFYRVAGAEMTLEPYVFSEATLEGQFKAVFDNNFADATANYRFSELKAGIAMDAAITAKFGIILDDRTIGIQGTWDNGGDAVLGPYYLVSLPSAEISALSAASPANGLLLGLDTTSGTLGFVKDNPVVSGYWQVYPEDSSTTFSASGGSARFDYSTDAEYELRYVYYSELGSFIRQYENFDVDLSDSDNDGLNNQYENFYSFLDPDNPLDADDDYDNDGYDNLSEYQNGSNPTSSSSYPGSEPDNALPSDFTATAGDEQVSLSWTRYADSTVYNIYRSDNSNCDLININTCSTTSGQSELFSNVSSPFTDTGLTNGTTYYYWIEAIHDGEVQLAEEYVRATLQATDAGFAINEDDYQEIYTHTDGTIYAVTKDTMNWDDARAMAQEQGGDLVTIHSEAENELVAGLLNGESAWLGASDDGDRIPGAFETHYTDSEDGWRWVDGSEFSYENWNSNEPNDAGTENCLHMRPNADNWNDEDCDTSDSYSAPAVFEFLPVNLSDGLVAHYEFDGNANDSSGNGYNGEVIGATLTSDRFGKANGAYHIAADSSYDRISIPAETVNGLEDFTISSWVKFDAENANHTTILSVANSQDDNELYVGYYAVESLWLIIVSGSWERFYGANEFPIDQWIHVTYTRQESKASIYLNGAFVDIITVGDYALGAGIGGVIIGQYQDSVGGAFDNTQPLNGDIDSLHIYNRALNSAEVQALYELDNNLDEGLVAHYEFEGNADDSSGNGNNGEEYGGISYIDGVIGQAASFDGIDDWLEPVNSTDYENGFTHVFWAKLRGDSSLSSRMYQTSGYDNRWQLRVVSWQIYLNVGEFTSGEINRDYLHHDFPNDEWSFVAFTFNPNGQITLTLNDYFSSFAFSDAEINKFTNSDRSLMFGYSHTDNYHYLIDGEIDDLRIYSRALSTAEIQTLHELSND